MEIGSVLHGFKLLKITELPEVGGSFYEMVHEKTGAKLGWTKTGDENKTFSITFKTVPEDHTGVFHILEHSVLQGSEKYPVKAPFVELIKSSMNTFLNAMTFPDKTMYPVSSRNSADFYNLMRVYMDAVLHPCLYKNENIFLQEGWHYESEEEGAVPFYNGVVLNEMRGANSSVDSLIFNYIQADLFPDNCYRFVAGGNPDAIPTLTYEKYKETHRRFYHPSNAFILLDGDIDLDRTLQILDREYLCAYEKENRTFPIPVQAPTGHVESEHPYAVEEEDGKAGYLGIGYVTGMFSDVKKGYAVKILADYLADTNESPVKKAILSANLASDVQASYVDSMLQPFLLFTVRNMDPADKQKVQQTISDTIRQVKEAGLDKEQLLALLAQLEFGAKERDFGGYPTGLINCMTVMDSWLYGGEPTANLETSSVFARLHREIEDGSFANYLDEFFLNNPHTAAVSMIPSTTYVEDEDAKEAAGLEAFWNQAPEEEKKALWEKQQALKNWQAVPNTPEECKCLPVLSLEDISEEPISLPMEILPDGTLWHGANTKGIRYLRMYLPMNFTEDEIPAASFLCTLFGNLALTSMDKMTLDMEKRRTFGVVDLGLEITCGPEEYESAKVYCCVEASYLEENEAGAFALLKKLLTETDYSNADSIGELLAQQQEGCQQAMIMNGHQMAMMRAKASCSVKSRLMELSDGPAYCNWIDEAAETFEEKSEAFCCLMQTLADKLLQADHVIVSMTSDGTPEGYMEKAKELLDVKKENDEAPGMPADGQKKTSTETEEANSESVSAGAAAAPSDAAGTPEKGSRISIPAPVAYSAKAGSLIAKGIENPGSWMVFSKLASMDYLWNQVRVQGGAYGTGMSVGADGTVGFFSYRDPNPENSLTVYNGTVDFMKEYCSHTEDLTRIIIGSISDTEPLLTPSAMGRVSDQWYFNGITDQLRRRRRQEVLHTTPEELCRLAEKLGTIIEDMDFCIVAN